MQVWPIRMSLKDPSVFLKYQMQSRPPEKTLQEAYTNRREKIPKTHM